MRSTRSTESAPPPSGRSAFSSSVDFFFYANASIDLRFKNNHGALLNALRDCLSFTIQFLGSIVLSAHGASPYPPPLLSARPCGTWPHQGSGLLSACPGCQQPRPALSPDRSLSPSCHLTLGPLPLGSLFRGSTVLTLPRLCVLVSPEMLWNVLLWLLLQARPRPSAGLFSLHLTLHLCSEWRVHP